MFISQWDLHLDKLLREVLDSSPWGLKQSWLILEVKAVNDKLYLKIVSERLKNYTRGWRRWLISPFSPLCLIKISQKIQTMVFVYTRERNQKLNFLAKCFAKQIANSRLNSNLCDISPRNLSSEVFCGLDFIDQRLYFCVTWIFN